MDDSGDLYLKLVSETDGFLATRDEWKIVSEWVSYREVHANCWFSYLHEFCKHGMVLNTAALSAEIDDIVSVKKSAPSDVSAILKRMRRVIGRGNRSEFAAVSNVDGSLYRGGDV